MEVCVLQSMLIFIGVRQIDDLILLTANESLKDRVFTCYDDGLELEPVDIKIVNGKQTTKFIGLEVNLLKGDVKVNVFNPNKDSLVTCSKQLKPRFVLPSMNRGSDLMKQIITGCLFRVRDYSIGGNQIVKGVLDYGYEFTSIGYNKKLFKSVVKGFVKKYVDDRCTKSWNISLAKF